MKVSEIVRVSTTLLGFLFEIVFDKIKYHVYH